MTISHSQKTQLALQGVMQCLVTHCGGVGYSFKIELIEKVIYVDIHYRRAFSQPTTRKVQFYITEWTAPMESAYNEVYKKIVEIEHSEERCIDGK